MRDFLLSRRRLLVATGSGVLGLAIVNTVAACSADEPAGDSAPTATAAASTGSAGPAGSAVGDWQRVSLSFVSAYLLIRGKEVAVVDLGTAGSEDAIGSALRAAGSDWSAVRHVILTHLHDDHVGGLPGVEPKVKATFYAGAGDAASIISGQPLKPVKEGDEVFGLRIIDTPGHTLGHVSIFDPSTGVLVAGDALRTSSGLESSDPQYTADEAKASASVRKLAALDVKAILPGHGDPLTDGAAEALRKLAAGLPPS